MSIVVVDTNLLVLLVVGGADRRCLSRHKRLSGFEAGDYELIEQVVGTFDDIAVAPNVLTEALNLALQIDGPVRGRISGTFSALVGGALEFYVPSMTAVARMEFSYLGLTDSVLLQLLLEQAGLAPTLLTEDERLSAEARRLGQRVVSLAELKQISV